jgi:hypothetical protein
MKKITMVLAVAAMSMILIGSVYAQTTVNQNLTLSVGTVYKMISSGNPAAMNITTGTAGTDALTAVTDNSTTYSITQNFGNTVKITAKLDVALAAGYTLTINLTSAKGTSIGAVDISNASAKDVVTGIAMGADAAKAITYSFSALASAGTLASTSKTVTLTLTN